MVGERVGGLVGAAENVAIHCGPWLRQGGGYNGHIRQQNCGKNGRGRKPTGNPNPNPSQEGACRSGNEVLPRIQGFRWATTSTRFDCGLARGMTKVKVCRASVVGCRSPCEQTHSVLTCLMFLSFFPGLNAPGFSDSSFPEEVC